MINESLVLDFNENVIPMIGYYDESYIDDEYDTMSYESAQFMIDIMMEENKIMEACILSDTLEVIGESVTAGVIVLITALIALVTAVIAKVISLLSGGGSGGGGSSSSSIVSDTIHSKEKTEKLAKKTDELLKDSPKEEKKYILDINELIQKFGYFKVPFDEPIYKYSSISAHEITSMYDLLHKKLAIIELIGKTNKCEFDVVTKNLFVKTLELSESMYNETKDFDAEEAAIVLCKPEKFKFIDKNNIKNAETVPGYDGLDAKSLADLKKSENDLNKSLEELKKSVEKTENECNTEPKYNWYKDEINKNMADIKQILNNLRGIISNTFRNYVSIFNKVSINISKYNREITSAKKECFQIAKEHAERAGYEVKCSLAVPKVYGRR